MVKKNMKKIDSCCIDCTKHEVISDRDPDDWFCDDDIAVICTSTKNPDRDLESKYLSDRSEFRSITASCRPYNKRKETKVPKWCPKE